MEEVFIEMYKNIGKEVRSRRKEKKLTQQQLADKGWKLDRSKISCIENGKEDFYFSTLLKVCEALEMDIRDLLINKK